MSEEHVVTPAGTTVYRLGLFFASVCTSQTDAEAVGYVNATQPTGISSDWEISPESFADGACNPSPCDRHPETHRHILMEC